MRKNKAILFLASILAFSAAFAFGACENQEQGGTEHTCSYVEEKAEDEYLKSPATCEDKAVYYKSCSCGEASETETFEYGNSLGHEYGEWLTNNDGTHSRYCDRDNAHSETKDCRGGAATCEEKATCEDCGGKYGELADHAFTEEKAEDKYLKTPATCTKKAVYYKSCVCGAASETETFEYGELAAHEFTEEKAEDKYFKSPATCTGQAVYYKSCVCGEASETEMFEYGNALEHKFGAWISNGNGTHTRTCEHDSTHAETKDCHGGTATCTEKATCADCGGKYGELAAHAFTEEKAEDKYLKSPATCEEKAVYYKSCGKCGESSTDDKATFTYGNVLEHKYSDWGGNGNGTHTKTCKNNGNHRITENCSGGTAMCTEQARCSKCGMKYGELAAHKFTMKRAEEKYLKSAATCEGKAVYYKSCSCGAASETETFEYGNALEHKFGAWISNGNGTHTRTCEHDSAHVETKDCHGGTATCTEKATCADCGGKYGELAAHAGGTATCTEKATCADCGDKYGELAAHVFTEEKAEYKYLKSNATCTKKAVYYKSCVCGKASKTETFEYGEFAAHNFTIKRAEKKYLKSAATCQSRALYYMSCVCGAASDEYWYEYGDYLGDHDYENHVCKHCGKEYQSEGLSFVLNGEGTAYTVAGIGSCHDADLVIPGTYNDLPVTSIGEEAFYYSSKLKSVVIPSSVTSIGVKAFYYCDRLESIEIPSSVTSIGESAFFYCRVLESVDISGVTSIGDNAFESCGILKSVKLSSGLTSIGAGAFSGCALLEDFEIPSGVTSIGAGAFYGCASLKSVEIPSGVTEIGMNTFCGCDSLTSIEIPSGVTSIGFYAFEKCHFLTSVVIGAGVKSIGSNAFSDCYKLVEVYNLSTLSIKVDTTNGCVAQNALGVYTSKDTPSRISTTDDGYVYYKNGSLVWLIGYNGTETELTLPEKIVEYSYDLYKYAFYGCTSLTSVVIPNGVGIYGKGTFQGCTSLESVTFSSSVTAIVASTFEDCTSLESVTFPSSVTAIASRAFYNCSSLASIDLSGIKGIGEYAFYNCKKLTEIVIPDSVRTVDSFAFSGCTSLTSVVIGDGLRIVDSHTFEYCTSLASVVIGAKVYGIQDYAFSNCRSLTSVVIPSSMTYIRSGFGGYYSHTNVYYRGGAESWEEIEINESLTNVTIYYYSESDPFAGENAATDGNYWHYVDGVLAVWTKQDGKKAEYKSAFQNLIAAKNYSAEQESKVTENTGSESVTMTELYTVFMTKNAVEQSVESQGESAKMIWATVGGVDYYFEFDAETNTWENRESSMNVEKCFSQLEYMWGVFLNAESAVTWNEEKQEYFAESFDGSEFNAPVFYNVTVKIGGGYVTYLSWEQRQGNATGRIAYRFTAFGTTTVDLAKVGLAGEGTSAEPSEEDWNKAFAAVKSAKNYNWRQGHRVEYFQKDGTVTQVYDVVATVALTENALRQVSEQTTTVGETVTTVDSVFANLCGQYDMFASAYSSMEWDSENGYFFAKEYTLANGGLRSIISL